MPDKYSTTGSIHTILNAETRGKYKTQRVVLAIPGYKDRVEYPCFEFFGDRCDTLENFREGDSVKIDWELKGREHKDRWYTTLSAFRIDSKGGQQSSPPDRDFDRPKGRTVQGHNDRDSVADESDEIPF
jgi:hypothetical protein